MQRFPSTDPDVFWLHGLDLKRPEECDFFTEFPQKSLYAERRIQQNGNMLNLVSELDNNF